MIILHYTLGFPPERSGGLVKYAMDLMQAQKEEGDKVYALFPGRISFIDRKMRIVKSRKNIKNTYEIINSFPLPLFGGVRNPNDFMKDTSPSIFADFLNLIKPDVIHIHTLMGLPKEFLDVAKKMSIKLIYTTHDYFGIAPEPTFYFSGRSYDDRNTVEEWAKVSRNAFTTLKLRIFQLRLYPLIRRILSVVPKYEKSKKIKQNYDIEKEPDIEYLKQMDQLRLYYSEMFKLIDVFHFNSSITREIYTRNLCFPINGKVISITNNSIKNRNTKYELTNNKRICIGYIGKNEEYKGFNDYLSLTKKISSSSFECHSFGYRPVYKIPKLLQHGKYTSNELQNIYNSIDVLIVPSKCKETFGFVALEALSYKTPVFVSKNVGAKDLIDDEFIFENVDDLVRKLNKWNLKYMFNHVKTMEEHVQEMNCFYQM